MRINFSDGKILYFLIQISILQDISNMEKLKFLFIFLVLAAMALSVAGICYENYLMEQTGNLLFLFFLFGYYAQKISARNLNFVGFFLCSIAAGLTSFFLEAWYFTHVALGFWMGSFIFLIREAVQTTEYRRGNNFILLYFIAVIGVYGYLLSLHVVEIEAMVTDGYLFSTYLLYYVNLLILGIAGLIYYLNSFSRKSVYFISLTLTFIFSDVLRDMGVFYFRDVSVEIVGTLIKFAAIKLAFLFFVTREKKLRLLNLV